jgi:hypothetical protein
MRMQLPVMDNRNNSIKNPDTRKISDATMRCLAKCIATFGIGLYIYAGEDLPDDSTPAEPINIEPMLNDIKTAINTVVLKEVYISAVKTVKNDTNLLKKLEIAKDNRKLELETV